MLEINISEEWYFFTNTGNVNNIIIKKYILVNPNYLIL